MQVCDSLLFGTGVSSAKGYEELRVVLGAAMDAGIRTFDTAPSYRTEEPLGRALRELAAERGMARADYRIQTKVDPWQMQDGRIHHFVEDALGKLGSGYVDTLLVHWPVPDYLDATWAELVALREEGLARRIGVCNVRERHVRRMLAEWDVPPQVAQIERNPLRVCAADVAACQAAGMEVQAYSALCKMDPRIAESEAVQRIAAAHGKSVGQVVLRWHLEGGVLPVFTSKRPERIREYTQLFDFSLSAEEVAAIDALNEDYKIYLESCICPGY